MVTFKKILFPTDFSASERPALLFAIHLAGLHQGEVVVQHVINDDIERSVHGAVAFDVGEIQQHMQRAAESDMKSLVTPLAGSVPLRPVLSRGGAAEEIWRAGGEGRR